MADYKVEITRYAESSMRAISRYIEFELKSPQAAKNTLQKISKGIFLLDTFPERFSLTEEEPWRTEGTEKRIKRCTKKHINDPTKQRRAGTSFPARRLCLFTIVIKRSSKHHHIAG